MKLFTEKKKSEYSGSEITYHATGWIALVAIVRGVVAVGMVGCPSDNMWQQKMHLRSGLLVDHLLNFFV